ncbi:type II secretion system F family protein [Cellulomonas endophytica]|uniref:type II secretion system F family protein n=1 Tax=Cellulomonas endophytica TaxID=2494735 RepID=UPI001013442D|nr:type II secretion system F family protein [Cellulomonas endophytica]
MAGTKTFQYAVRDRGGKLVKGRIEATTTAAVANRLRTMGLAPVAITEVTTTGLRREVRLPALGERVGLKDIAVMARQMATMVSSGLSLIRTLSILAEQTQNKTLARVLGRVRHDVENGQALSVSLGAHKDVFPPLMVNIVRAGETGGFLDDALLSVAANYESEVRLRSTIKAAMTYPVMVFGMAVLAVVGMLVFIVPVFQDMFAGMGGTLPLPTRVLVELSHVMRYAGPVLLVAGLVGAWWWGKHRYDARVRSVVDPLKLRLPVFGTLFKKVAIARFSRNFGTMMGAGVPILQALDIVGETSGNWAVERAVVRIKESVRNGHPLAGPLGEHPVFPPMVVQMIAVGEDAGALETMLGKIAEFYDQEVQSTTEQLTSLIEPLMIAVLGVVIGGMIVALYLPIFDIFTLIE